MAVVNKVPATLGNIQISAEDGGLRSAAVKWAEDNGEWLSRVIEIHETNVTEDEIEKYQAAYDGFLESIDERDKSRGDGINHKLQVGMAQLIIDTVVDYMTGIPISWTVEDPEGEADKTLVEEYRKEILKLLRSENAQRVLSEQLRQGCIVGLSPIIAWANDDKSIEYEEFPIQEVIPVYDNRGRLRLVLRKYEVTDETSADPTAKTKVEVYDQKYVTYYVKGKDSHEFQLDEDEEETGNPIRHFAGRIPVSVYINGTPAKYEDRKKKTGVSDLKVAFTLLENLAGAVSDKANTVDRLLDQFLKLTNVDTDEGEVIKMRRARAIALKNKDSNADFIAPKQEDTAIENHLDRVSKYIRETTQTPNIGEIGGATATEIKVKFMPLDTKAGKKENYFVSAVKQFVAVLTDMLNYRRLTEANVEDPYLVITGQAEPPGNTKLFNADWVAFSINKNLPQNYQEIATIVSQLAGTVPDSYLYDLLWFIDDPVEALAEMKKQKKADTDNQAKLNASALGFGGEFGETGTNNQEGGGNSGD